MKINRSFYVTNSKNRFVTQMNATYTLHRFLLPFDSQPEVMQLFLRSRIINKLVTFWLEKRWHCAKMHSLELLAPVAAIVAVIVLIVVLCCWWGRDSSATSTAQRDTLELSHLRAQL